MSVRYEINFSYRKITWLMAKLLATISQDETDLYKIYKSLISVRLFCLQTSSGYSI